MDPKPKSLVRLREAARARIRSGRLPGRIPSSTWGGLGTGARCDVCERFVSHDHVEVHFHAPSEDGRQGAAYSMHVTCFTAWEAELLDGAGRVVCSERSSSQPTAACHDPEESIRRSR
jgi:hypothetical protein